MRNSVAEFIKNTNNNKKQNDEYITIGCEEWILGKKTRVAIEKVQKLLWRHSPRTFTQSEFRFEREPYFRNEREKRRAHFLKLAKVLGDYYKTKFHVE